MAKTETTKFDAANYLDSAEAISAYLDAYLEDATPEELRNALATVARSHGISDLARRSGVTSDTKSGPLEGMARGLSHRFTFN